MLINSFKIQVKLLTTKWEPSFNFKISKLIEMATYWFVHVKIKLSRESLS